MGKELALFEKLQDNPQVGIITLNREEAGNALNTEMLNSLSEKLTLAETDLSVRVVILRSQGRHSSFGADLQELVIEDGDHYRNISRGSARKHIEDGRRVVRQMFCLRVPIIGIVHGFTLGGGAEIYSLCDILYGASGGKEEGGLVYGYPEATIGVMAGWMGPEMLTRLIGAQNAKDLHYRGSMIAADEALRRGIVQRLLPLADLFPQAVEWAKAVAGNAPFAVESARRTTNRVLFPDFDELLKKTAQETVSNLLTEDFLLGAAKILKKKKEAPTYNRR